MEYLSKRLQKAALVFQTIGFAEARDQVMEILTNEPSEAIKAEAKSLLLRINIERDDPKELDSCYHEALALKRLPELSLAALYQLGIVFTLCEDVDAAEECYQRFLNNCPTTIARIWGEYGMAAVAYNRKESEKTLELLSKLESQHRNLTTDFRCLIYLLRGNCQRALSAYNEALQTYGAAQKLLPEVKTFYLKNWIFFGMATIEVRRGNASTAKTLFEIVLSLTHPVDFRRLYRIAQDELDRLQLDAEVLFDPIRGDIISTRGCLTLRGKPILISILHFLIEHSPNSCSKESLYLWVWKGEYHPLRHDGLLYSHIQRLRQLLSSDPHLKDFILTTTEGYRLNPDIRVRLKERPLRRSEEVNHDTKKMDINRCL